MRVDAHAGYGEFAVVGGAQLLRTGRGADIVMIDVHEDIRSLVNAMKQERIVAPVVACGIGYVALDPGHEAPRPTPVAAQRDVMVTGSLASSSTGYRDLLKPGKRIPSSPARTTSP